MPDVQTLAEQLWRGEIDKAAPGLRREIYEAPARGEPSSMARNLFLAAACASAEGQRDRVPGRAPDHPGTGGSR